MTFIAGVAEDQKSNSAASWATELAISKWAESRDSVRSSQRFTDAG